MNKHQGLDILEGLRAPRMADRTTLRLGGRVLAELRLRHMDAAPLLFEQAQRLGGKLVCLGAGSNILADDADLPLVAARCELSPELPEGLKLEGDDAARMLVRVPAGQKLPVALGRLAKMGCSGLEGLAGIPGTVGGAVAMNAGSFGVCMGDVLEAVTVLTPDQGVRTITRSGLRAAYRTMRIPGLSWFMVLDAVLRLRRDAPEAIRARMREHMAKKWASQPVAAASAGCVFKNPSPDRAAGKLLDEAGFKGMRLGGMAFSALHANFLINEGNGTAAEAHELIRRAKDAVLARHGIVLETEVHLWP